MDAGRSGDRRIWSFLKVFVYIHLYDYMNITCSFMLPTIAFSLYVRLLNLIYFL